MGLSEQDWSEWLAIRPRLGLGTAQLGIPYGIANRTGLPSDEAARAVVECAWKLGIRCFDTSRAYGESEARLGRYLGPLCGAERPILCTKILDSDARAGDALEAVRQSRRLLGSIWGLLLHGEPEASDAPGRWRPVFREAKAEGLTRYSGVSVYSVEAAENALSLDDADIVQLPSSCLDRRFLRAGVFERAERQRVALFVRSVFLQGLIGQNPEDVPNRVPRARDAVRELHRFCGTRRFAPRPFALAYALRRMGSAVVLFGTETPEQVADNVRMAAEASAIPADALDAWDDVWPDDLVELIDPRTWPKAGARPERSRE